MLIYPSISLPSKCSCLRMTKVSVFLIPNTFYTLMAWKGMSTFQNGIKTTLAKEELQGMFRLLSPVRAIMSPHFPTTHQIHALPFPVFLCPGSLTPLTGGLHHRDTIEGTDSRQRGRQGISSPSFLALAFQPGSIHAVPNHSFIWKSLSSGVPVLTGLF